MAKTISILFIRNATSELKRVATENSYIIRDPSAYVEGEFVEPCNVVSGDAPAVYKAKAEYIDASDLVWLKPFIDEPEQKPTRKTK